MVLSRACSAQIWAQVGAHLDWTGRLPLGRWRSSLEVEERVGGGWVAAVLLLQHVREDFAGLRAWPGQCGPGVTSLPCPVGDREGIAVEVVPSRAAKVSATPDPAASLLYV